MNQRIRCRLALVVVGTMLSSFPGGNSAFSEGPSPSRAPELLRRELYARTVELAWLSWQRGEVTRAQELLKSTEPGLRSWEYDYLLRAFDGSDRRFEIRSGGKLWGGCGT